MKILVVDDDKVVSAQMCGLLRQRGYVPIPVFDSTQALMTALRAPHPDGIILDIALPGGSGIDLLRKLKSNARTTAIPVLVVSGTLEQKHSDTVLEAGAYMFLPKPIDPATLGAAVEQGIGPAPRR